VGGTRAFVVWLWAIGPAGVRRAVVGGGVRWAGFNCGLKLRFAINFYGNTCGNFPAQIQEPRIRSGNDPNYSCSCTRRIPVFFPVFLLFLLKRVVVGLCGIRCRSVRDFPITAFIPRRNSTSRRQCLHGERKRALCENEVFLLVARVGKGRGRWARRGLLLVGC
jgi:hypothetical protein